MISTPLSARERMLAALNFETVDYPPCSFMLYKGLLTSSRDYLDFITQQSAMGLDATIMLPPRPPVVINDHYNLHGLPVSHSPEVQIEEWKEEDPAGKNSILIKEYHTPAGILRAEVKQTDDWRWGNHVPFLDDYISSRSKKYLITDPEDLPKLQYLLQPPTMAEIATTRTASQPIINHARTNGLLVSGGWGVGADLLGWVLGLEEMVFASYDRPDFLKALLDMIARWNQERMTVLLEMGLDLYIKRAWYETCHFWSPKAFRKYIFPILKAEVDLAHAARAKFGYIVTSNTMPLLELYAEAGVDVLMGVDPLDWDLEKSKKILNGRVCLWGGVNGQLTVERGTVTDVRKEVRTAIEVLAPGGGFILSPVDNVRHNDEITKQNVSALIDEWRCCQ